MKTITVEEDKEWEIKLIRLAQQALIERVEGALTAIADTYENEVMRVETERYFSALKKELQ